MQTLPRLANPHRRTDWLKTCQILGLMQEVLFGEMEDLNLRRASRKVLVGGQSEKIQTSPCSKWRDGGLHSSLATLEITGQLMTLAVERKEKQTGERRKEHAKLNTLYGKRELSSLCSADFGLYKVSGRKAGTDSPWLAHRWAGQCWTWELPQRGIRASAGLCWAQDTTGALHVGSHCEWQQFGFLKDSNSWCLVDSWWPVSPLTWAGKIHIGTAPLKGAFFGEDSMKAAWKVFWCTG